MKKTIFDLLFEQETANAVSNQTPEAAVSIQGDGDLKARKPNDSVDDQIDALILMYESKSIKDEVDDLNESLTYNSLSTFLLEQDEAPEEEAVETETPDIPGMTDSDDPSGSDSVEVEEKAEKDLVPDLDVDMFTKRIARLIMNYRNLLRIEDVILNRGKNYLDENYGDAFVAKYLDSLESQFGIKVSEFNEEGIQDAPFAIGANPAGAGAVGGA